MWVDEKTGDYLNIQYKAKEKLFSKQSEFQKVEVYDCEFYGKMLFNEDLVMVSEKDEFVYHDMITHVPMFTHPDPKNVLVIGGGDGGTAREVLRHSSVEHCTMVEIDGVVVDACKEFIPQTSKDLSHPKLTLLIDDGVKFVREAKESGSRFDVIIVDSSEPIGPSTPLFGLEFYQDIYSILNEDGIVVSQGESPYYHQEMQVKLMSILSETFPKTNIYNYANLTYPGGFWSFTYASKSLCPLNDFKSDRLNNSNLDFEYYNEEIHRASFAIPNFQKKMLCKFIKR